MRWSRVIRAAHRGYYFQLTPEDALWLIVLLLGYFIIGLVIVNAFGGR